MGVSEWFLSPSQRGNPGTGLDRRHRDGSSWTIGNDVEALIHGAAYFPELLRCVRAMRAGDLLLFTDWRGDPDQLLDGPGTEVAGILSEAAARGVVVKGLIWRSHLDRFALSEEQNRHLGEDIEAAGGDRVGVYGIENPAGTPVYVHAKVCVVDDVWASVGSDNVNRRSWTHDSELSCAVIDESVDEREPRMLDRFGDGARVFARELRLQLAREHLEREVTDDADLLDPIGAFAAFSVSALRLQQWHDHGRTGPRPPGRLRPYAAARLTRRTLAWATPLYRMVADPDGRPRALRRAHRF
jgi:phosphatidylserine/phosphatidylglycerophosphate/cardiolipin synthase-like enzyme